MIITIVQYVVIARGAERVAEVAARFALDGLPGHQSAIDADLRAGVISASEASKRRARLADRSNFYGAMDGAVRFVKGDAVAGLAITSVNLLGGLAIGMGRLDYTWQESLEVYGRLTVGDGLLAQIPALLVSLAAGVLVSRVDRQDDRGLSAVRWLEPAMLVVPATMLVVLAAVPAMPSLAFVTTAVAFSPSRSCSPRAARAAPGPSAHRRAADRGGDGRKPTSRTAARSERALGEVRLQASAALGIDVPPVELEVRSQHPPGEVEVLLDERRCGRADVTRGREGEDAVVIATYRAIMDSAESLVDLQDLDRSLEQVRASHPVVVARRAEVDLADLLTVMRAFLRERIPLPPLRDILGTMAEGRRFADPAERPHFAEIVRRRLTLHWVHPVVDGLRQQARTRWVRLTPDAEQELLDRAASTAEGTALNLTHGERNRWREALESGAAPEDPDTELGPLVLITTPRARQAAAALTHGKTPVRPGAQHRRACRRGTRAGRSVARRSRGRVSSVDREAVQAPAARGRGQSGLVTARAVHVVPGAGALPVGVADPGPGVAEPSVQLKHVGGGEVGLPGNRGVGKPVRVAAGEDVVLVAGDLIAALVEHELRVDPLRVQRINVGRDEVAVEVVPGAAADVVRAWTSVPPRPSIGAVLRYACHVLPPAPASFGQALATLVRAGRPP